MNNEKNLIKLDKNYLSGREFTKRKQERKLELQKQLNSLRRIIDKMSDEDAL